MPDLERFRKDLTDLINACSLENLSNTPDFMLADYLVDCLLIHGASVSKRDAWYGHTTGSFTIRPGHHTLSGDVILSVRKDGDNNFTIDLEPQETELGRDPQS